MTTATPSVTTSVWAPSPGRCFAFTCDGGLVISGQWPEKLERYDGPDFDTPTASLSLKDLTHALATSPTTVEVLVGKKTAVAFDGKTLAKRKVSLKGHRYELGAIAYAPSGNVVFTGGGGHVEPLDDVIRAFDVDGNERSKLAGVGGVIGSLLPVDDTFVVAKGPEIGIGGYDLARGERSWRLDAPQDMAHGPATIRGDEVVCALATQDAAAWWVLAVLDARTGVERKRIPLFHVSDFGHVEGIVVRGAWAAVSMGQNAGDAAARKARVHWIQLATGERGPVLEADEQTHALALSPDGRWLAAHMGDVGIAVFDLRGLTAIGEP